MAADPSKSLDPDVEYALLSGLDKSAILMSSLGPSPAKLIFKYMKDNDVKRLINQMAILNKSPIWMVKRVLEEFYSALNEDADLLFSENKGRNFILDTLGEDRAKQLLGQIVDVGTSNTLESLVILQLKMLETD